ncbi:MAG TPA: flagellar basal body M-ring protein FliF [Gammaproteobacteria bacterium]|nr:flagellar basal body M-ring protein FliF [Gammaproteobacteria bacterium]
MALVKTEEIISQSRGFGSLPFLRQLGLMIGLAASVAIGVAVVLWSRTPSYSLLYSNLGEQDVSEIAQALQQADIPYKLSRDASTIMVPGDKVHDARLKLASQGLPKGFGVGFELLDRQQTFGVSQFMENARYQRALEGELARTIASLRKVRSARVHLAIPKQTAFVRSRKKPSASVTVDLYAGRSLDEEQVAAIAHMVAASVPDMEVDQVTIIDQRGRLLTDPSRSSDMRLTASQFEHRKRIEEYLTRRIENILVPVMGENAVRAQVTADIDFTVTEQTRESYNPDLPAIRSEQIVEEQDSGGASQAAGIPGSVSNQPGGADKGQVASAQAPASPQAGGQAAGGAQTRSSRSRVIRNYELDKTISHTRSGGGAIRRLSVAVVVDDKTVVGENGEVSKQPLSQEELDRLTALVKEAVGFDATRGDRVNVVNTAFSTPPEPEPLPEPSLLENDALWSMGKQGLGILLVLFLIFGVLKPVMRDLAAKGRAVPAAGGGGASLPPGMAEDQLTLSGPQGVPQLPAGESSDYESNLTAARNLASQDPKRVAQVVNNWVSNE